MKGDSLHVQMAIAQHHCLCNECVHVQRCFKGGLSCLATYDQEYMDVCTHCICISKYYMFEVVQIKPNTNSIVLSSQALIIEQVCGFTSGCPSMYCTYSQALIKSKARYTMYVIQIFFN